MIMCTRCKKRPAVMFISAISGTERKNEGLCLTCAKEMGLPQASEYLSQMGISEEDFENACDSMLNDNGGIDDELLSKLGFDSAAAEADEDGKSDASESKEGESLFERGGAGTVPDFLKNLFGSMEGSKDSPKNGDDSEDNSDRRSRKKSEKTDKKRRCLETYCTNLTKRAQDGEIDRIVGREKEIYRVLQILSRRTKNNPCLIGEPGVGKTAIAEGIALKLASGDVPFRLQ